MKPFLRKSIESCSDNSVSRGFCIRLGVLHTMTSCGSFVKELTAGDALLLVLPQPEWCLKKPTRRSRCRTSTGLSMRH